MRSRDRTVVCIDPLYAFSSPEIDQRIHALYPTLMEQLRASQSDYVWNTIPTPEHCAQLRWAAMHEFLADFDRGKAEGRYLPIELPNLPFDERQFDLALCSHLLFTYSQQLSVQFHCQAMLEMCRVAGEARLFPLLDLGCRPSPHVQPVCECLEAHGFYVQIQRVDYEFQRNGNQMLRAWR